MRRALRWGMLAGALAMAIPSTALADGDAAELEAQARFEEGIARVKAGNFAGARVSFTQAYAVLHRPYILWNLALAEEKTGHALEALEHFKAFARGKQDGEDRGAAQKHIAELMGQTGHFDVVAPGGSQVFVDGGDAGTAPLADSVDVAPGRHHVQAHTPQGAKEVDVDVVAGQVVRVSLLPVVASAPPLASGPTAPAPAVPSDNAAPTDLARRRVAASPASISQRQTPPNDSSTRRTIVVVLVAATAAVSMATGAYFGLQSESDASTAAGFRELHSSDYCFQVTDANASVCKQWNDAVQAQGRDAALSNVLYVTGGVLAVGAVATWLLWPKGAASASALLMPAVAPGCAGSSAFGRF